MTTRKFQTEAELHTIFKWDFRKREETKTQKRRSCRNKKRTKRESVSFRPRRLGRSARVDLHQRPRRGETVALRTQGSPKRVSTFFGLCKASVAFVSPHAQPLLIRKPLHYNRNPERSGNPEGYPRIFVGFVALPPSGPGRC